MSEYGIANQELGLTARDLGLLFDESRYAVVSDEEQRKIGTMRMSSETFLLRNRLRQERGAFLSRRVLGVVKGMAGQARTGERRVSAPLVEGLWYTFMHGLGDLLGSMGTVLERMRSGGATHVTGNVTQAAYTTMSAYLKFCVTPMLRSLPLAMAVQPASNEEAAVQRHVLDIMNSSATVPPGPDDRQTPIAQLLLHVLHRETLLRVATDRQAAAKEKEQRSLQKEYAERLRGQLHASYEALKGKWAATVLRAVKLQTGDIGRPGDRRLGAKVCALVEAADGEAADGEAADGAPGAEAAAGKKVPKKVTAAQKKLERERAKQLRSLEDTVEAARRRAGALATAQGSCKGLADALPTVEHTRRAQSLPDHASASTLYETTFDRKERATVAPKDAARGGCRGFVLCRAPEGTKEPLAQLRNLLNYIAETCELERIDTLATEPRDKSSAAQIAADVAKSHGQPEPVHQHVDGRGRQPPALARDPCDQRGVLVVVHVTTLAAKHNDRMMEVARATPARARVRLRHVRGRGV